MKDLVNQGGKQRFRAEIPVQFFRACVPGFFHWVGVPGFFPKRIFVWETPLEIKRMKDLVNQRGKQRFRAEIPVQYFCACVPRLFHLGGCARFFSFGWVCRVFFIWVGARFFSLGGGPETHPGKPDEPGQ